MHAVYDYTKILPQVCRTDVSHGKAPVKKQYHLLNVRFIFAPNTTLGTISLVHASQDYDGSSGGAVKGPGHSDAARHTTLP